MIQSLRSWATTIAGLTRWVAGRRIMFALAFVMCAAFWAWVLAL